MSKFAQELQDRAVKGFERFGYTLAADDGIGIWSEFRKPDTALHFSLRYSEGGVVLCWTDDQECSLLGSKPAPEVSCQSFCGSPEEFWEAVAGIFNAPR